MRILNTWKSILAALLFIATAHGMQAQSLAQQGKSVESLVPDGWEYQEAQGDLNKDGIMDLVVVAKSPLTPILAIYFGNREGNLKLWKQYDNVIPEDEGEYCHNEISLEITNRGTLRISSHVWCSMGSYGTSDNDYIYRYQHGDFYLIGMDQQELQRNTGEHSIVSENYLTWKRQVKTDNAFDEEVEPTEKWTKLKKKPLEKLGAREL